MHDYQTIPRGLRREKRRDLDRDGLAGHLPIFLGLATANLSQRRCRAIIGRMPSTFYIVAVCYATAVILLGLAPWNILLILLLFLGRNRRLRLRAFDMSRGSFL